ncbi:hypothetical protein C9374_003314 [Naegleria lovaniensis]|uniref:Uncharacterized protein n=1 Tax=Naegleria lovaniensis TaxID=51637 RepID=A0AA88GSU6_NAELO|nr:uncharacterized protein C9374_003314 [Naegleria lovaniensis]KAG2385499.1 hypothetical protein C9374_003314 [Naegleria lovaniensis]
MLHHVHSAELQQPSNSSYPYYFNLSLNATANNHSLYFSPLVFVNPSVNNTTPYPSFGSVMIDSGLYYFTDYSNFRDSMMYFTSNKIDVCQYVRQTGNNIAEDGSNACEYIFCDTNATVAEPFYKQLAQGSILGLVEMYCKYCDLGNNTLKARVWNVSTCPYIRRTCEVAMSRDSSMDQAALCGSEQSTCLPFPYFDGKKFSLDNLYYCYCENENRWGIDCKDFGVVDARLYIDWIVFTLAYGVEAIIAIFVLFLPGLLQISYLKAIRYLFLRFNTYIRTLWTGSAENPMGYADEQIYGTPFKWFSVRHLRLIVMVVISISLFSYTLVRIICHAAKPFGLFAITDVFLALCFYFMTTGFLLIAVLWSNIALSDKRKGGTDVLMMPLRVILFVVLGLMLLLAIAYIIAEQLLTLASGIVLIFSMIVFIGLAVALFSFGLKLYWDLSKIRKDGVSITSLRFTKFMFASCVVFALTCLFFLLAALTKVSHTGILSKYYALWQNLFVDFFMLCHYALLIYILYDHKAAMDLYEFVYWPFCSCCFRKNKSSEK